jgi:hypothetical protein
MRTSNCAPAGISEYDGRPEGFKVRRARTIQVANLTKDMSMNGARIVGGLMVVGLGALWAYNSFIVEPEKQRQRHTERRADAAQRFKDWAYVAKEKEVAPGETVKLVIIPSAYGVDFLDIKCLVYTHREFKTSSMICPDADRSQLAENEQ